MPPANQSIIRPVVLVTGSSSGIGAATVHRFSRSGWRVIATTRREHNPFENQTNVRVVRMEQTDPASVAEAITSVAEAEGRIDVLVNNAGYCLMGPLEAVTMAQIRCQFEVNVFGLIEVTRAALPYLKRAAADRLGQAGIVNIASISADNGYPFNAVYSSSKGAVMSLTEGLNIELYAVGLFAKAVLPGLIATDIFTKLDAPDAMPEAYDPMWKKFTGMQSEVMGFAPEMVAETIFEAASDGKADKVCYYPTPDAASVPRAKRMLGQDGYWRTFRKALLDGPSWLQRRVSPRGDRDVRIVLPQINLT